jgi:hypothetical protein
VILKILHSELLGHKQQRKEDSENQRGKTEDQGG